MKKVEDSATKLIDAQDVKIVKLKSQIKALRRKIRYLDKYAEIQADCMQFCYEFDGTCGAVKEALDKLEKLKH